MTNSYRCPFAKALLSGHSRCKNAESFHIAERHGMQCSHPEAQAICEDVATQLHEQSRFALGVTQLPQQMTSNMELRIQCGGINGLLDSTADFNEPSPVDIHRLVVQAISEFGTIEQLPYSRIAQSISQWSARRRTRRRE